MSVKDMLIMTVPLTGWQMKMERKGKKKLTA